MTISAFHGDPALKAELINPLRARWAANELLPASILKWMPEERIYSLCGAMVESQDKDVFQQRTGIPLELAMLSEALISASIEVTGDPSNPLGFIIRGDNVILAFGMEWLDAVRPGADLTDVVPRYAVQLLQSMLRPDFVLSEHIEPALAAVAARLLDLWQRELAGQSVDAQEWRAVRAAALQVSEAYETPWGFPITMFVESMGWPIRSIAGEFVGLFQPLAQTWLNYLRLPFFEEQDRADQTLSMIGWHRLWLAEREGELDEAAMNSFFDDMPDINRAMHALGDADTRERLRAARVSANVVTTPMIRQQMDLLLKLIASA
ncbi:hypothetical protein [Undibacterium sp. RuTC16W]|uniref:hypothetical protein n=1 Tax=Undibacterium sp. RuTC16W TaxID=3413048 RepID=UPI003BF08E8A